MSVCACAVGCVQYICIAKVNGRETFSDTCCFLHAILKAGRPLGYFSFKHLHVSLRTLYCSFVNVPNTAVMHPVTTGRLCNRADVRSLDVLRSPSLCLFQWLFSLPAGVWGSVADPRAAGVLFPVQPAPSPQSRCVAAGTQAAHWPGEVRALPLHIIHLYTSRAKPAGSSIKV